MNIKRTIITVLLLMVSFGLGFLTKSFISQSSENKTNLPATTNSGKRVTGIGGIFFKCKDPQKVRDWYKLHLGLNTDQYGTNFEWRLATDSTKKGFTQWSPFAATTTYFEPSKRDFMINYRVENLENLVEELKKEGVTIADTIETYDYEKFVHIIDIEGNKVELWQPEDLVYDKFDGGRTK